MRKILLTLAAGLIAAPLLVISQEPEKKDAAAAPAGEPTMKDLSYALGTQIGKQLKQTELDFDMEAFNAGITDTLKGKGSKFDEAKTQEIMAAFQQKMQAKMAEKSAGEAGKNKAAGKTFLDTNGKREGVKTTASGLQYEVLKEGTGPKPAGPTANVQVHYHGTLLDGTVFDSSVQRNMPAEFPLNGVIAGWTEGVQLMPTGSKFKFFIPSDLAYGDGGRPGIPPGATLVFEVELLAIK